MKSFKCAQCGVGQVKPVAKVGRRAAFKHIPDLEVPATLELPTCEVCGTQWLDEESAELLDSALAEVYRRELSKKANAALRRLRAAKLRQWDLEPMLGLSPGYLSKVKTGKDVSPMLAAVLVLLAEDPSRVSELKNAWRCIPHVGFQVSAMRQLHVKLFEGSRSQPSQARSEGLLNLWHVSDVQPKKTRLMLEPERDRKHTPASEFLGAAA
jgi:hypothetical protein